MARPCKSAKVLTNCSQTKGEINKRIAHETKLKGKADKLKPPAHLNTNQRKLFKYIVNELEQADILGNLDVYILETCVIAIDRKREIDRLINDDINQAFDPQVIGAKKKYTDELFRCCNELSLSPQARAKLGNINLEAQKQNSDPLLKVLQCRKKE